MEEQNDFSEKKFDSFLNKTIIYSSRTYFKKQMKTNDKENILLDNEDCTDFLENYANANIAFTSIDELITSMQLKTALNCLSDIEQAVIFLLFNEDLSQEKASKILEIWSKSISRIKIRAIEKLKKYMEGDLSNEK